MQTFSLLFYPKKPKNYSTGGVYIYGRITMRGKRCEISTGHTCDPAKWNSAGGKPIGNSEEVKSLIAYLEGIKRKIYDSFSNLQNKGAIITAEEIKNEYLGKQEKPINLIEIFRDHNKKIEELIGSEYAEGTVERYKTSLKHTLDFIKWKYHVSDYEIKKIDHSFITEYEFYLRSERKCANNSAIKYIKNFGKIIRICLANDWIKKDPFINYKGKIKKVEKTFLNQHELDAIREKDFKNERLNLVKDIFLYSCYTGLAYADVRKLSGKDLTIGIDGETWLRINRQKTETQALIPLLPFAEEILTKYKNHPKCQNEGRLIPILSNQKMNAYLKEIASVCGINRELTFHIARHTFATTITLGNGVPIETVMKMLGHKDLKITLDYAKILDQKISQDMKALKDKFNLKVVHTNNKAAI